MTDREKFIQAAIVMQKLCADSYLLARMAYKRGFIRVTAHYQQQAARDHEAMRRYLEKVK